MTRTPAKATLLAVALTLGCTLMPAAAAMAAGDTGGAGAPTGRPASHAGRSAESSATHGTQIATWFGPGFYGQKTACGQTLTPLVVGVASRTLPCGTLVLVDYRGHRLTVPVIDRGPYAHNGAAWDLTWGAASALSIGDTVRVRTKIVGSAPNSPLLGAPAEAQPSAAQAATGGTTAN
jgi:rare lipoprotein A (peptidoglycan hydrolase)